MLRQLELEQSKKCDHEIRHEEDQKKAAAKKAGETVAKEGPITTATDDEDAWKKEFASFTAASRKTSK